MKLHSAILIIVLCTLFPVSVHPQDDVADTLYKEGLRKYILKDYSGAIIDLETSFKLDGENLKIKNMYLNSLVKQGHIEYDQGNLTAAEQYYNRALALAGEDEELKKRLSLVQEQIRTQSREVVTPSAPVQETGEVVGIASSKTTVPPAETRQPVPTDTQAAQLAPPESGMPRPEVFRGLSVPAVVQVELPFDIDEFIRSQNEENKRILDEIIKAQKEERENLFRNMQIIAEAQREDRQFFNRSLILVLAGAGGIVLIPMLVILVIFLLRRHTARRDQPTLQTRVALAQRPALLLEAAEGVDETEYIEEEYFPEIVRAKRLRDLYQEFVHGHLSWDVVSEYISELNRELKDEILHVVERKIENPEAKDLEATLPVLFPLITDEESDIGLRSRHLAAKVTESQQIPRTGGAGVQLPARDDGDPLSLNSLLQIARLVDNRSGIHGHSTQVADICFQIAEQLNNPEIDPLDARKVGLVHNIGYLDIDDQLFRYEGPLTEEQFEVVKSHPELGVRLLDYANPPQIFANGIRYHHERLDGSGYPHGLQREKIPLIARIIAVADSFAAATSPRPYRNALSVAVCFKMMEEIAGTLIDEELFRILREVYSARLDEKS